MNMTEEERAQMDVVVKELRKESANVIIEIANRIVSDDFNTITLREEIDLLKEQTAALEFISLYRDRNP